MSTVSAFPKNNVTIAGQGTYVNPQSVSADDGNDATALHSNATGTETFGNEYKSFGFDISIPSGSTIQKVELLFEIGDSDPSGSCSGTYSLKEVVSGVVGTGGSTSFGVSYPTAFTFDVTADRAWVLNDLLDANFSVQQSLVLLQSHVGPPGGSSQLDYVKVRVTFTPRPTRSIAQVRRRMVPTRFGGYR